VIPRFLLIISITSAADGLLSWLVAIALSVPLTLLVDNVVGDLPIQTPLEIALSLTVITTSFASIAMHDFLARIVRITRSPCTPLRVSKTSHWRSHV
jgi:hypothetical protein